MITHGPLGPHQGRSTSLQGPVEELLTTLKDAARRDLQENTEPRMASDDSKPVSASAVADGLGETRDVSCCICAASATARRAGTRGHHRNRAPCWRGHLQATGPSVQDGFSNVFHPTTEKWDGAVIRWVHLQGGALQGVQACCGGRSEQGALLHPPAVATILPSSPGTTSMRSWRAFTRKGSRPPPWGRPSRK